jgi:putative aldouronate transport system permease protein
MDVTSKMIDKKVIRDREETRWKVYFRRSWPLYVMILPAIILLFLFSYYPMYGIIIAFQRYNPGLGFADSPWVGTRNFERLFANPVFYNLLRNTFLIASGKIFLMHVASISLALLLNEVRQLFFKRVIQSVIYLPHFLSWIVLGGILIDTLSSNGILNMTLTRMGLPPVQILTNNSTFVPMLWITHLWKEVGWSTIVYLAALTGVDPQLYEAAAMDGAGRFSQALHVSIPGLLGVIVIMVTLSLGNVLNAGFDQVFNLYNPSVYRTADIIDTWVYRQGIVSSQFSLAAAAGLFSSVINFMMIVSGIWAARRWVNYRLF